MTGERSLLESYLWMRLLFVGSKVWASMTPAVLLADIIPPWVVALRGVDMNFLLEALIIVDELIGGWIEVGVSIV